MYFYIDESGHTGPNLFDRDQPTLYYGVLSSRVNVDALAAERLKRLRTRMRVQRLHAAELGNNGLLSILDDLVRLQSQLDLRFDLYRVNKPDHSVITFFDQVFDQGLNPAVTWTGYWTPMRYVLLLKLATLFDEDLAERAWHSRIELDDAKSQASLVAVCTELRARVYALPDARSRQLISDSLEWAATKPGELYYNAKTKEDRLAIMPNIIGFQSVMLGIADRLLNVQARAVRVIVDQQSQFNKAQKALADFYVAARSVPFKSGPGLPEISFKGIPTVPIEFSSSSDSAGLEIVDIYLWVFKRAMEKRELAPELYALVQPQLRRGRTDEISLRALAHRWEQWFEKLPEPTADQIVNAKELLAFDEVRRLRAIDKVNT
jgi:Protein of unknown function (DUF3800)